MGKPDAPGCRLYLRHILVIGNLSVPNGLRTVAERVKRKQNSNPVAFVNRPPVKEGSFNAQNLCDQAQIVNGQAFFGLSAGEWIRFRLIPQAKARI
jgi:hypothetical protein